MSCHCGEADADSWCAGGENAPDSRFTRPAQGSSQAAGPILAIETPSGKILFSNASQVHAQGLENSKGQGFIQVRCLLYCHGKVEDAMKLSWPDSWVFHHLMLLRLDKKCRPNVQCSLNLIIQRDNPFPNQPDVGGACRSQGCRKWQGGGGGWNRC